MTNLATIVDGTGLKKKKDTYHVPTGTGSIDSTKLKPACTKQNAESNGSFFVIGKI